MIYRKTFREYESEKLKTKFHYVHINHAIRKKADQESKRVKKILSKQNIDLKIITNSGVLRLSID